LHTRHLGSASNCSRGSCPGVAGDSTDKGVHAGTVTPASIHMIMLLPMQELKESGELLLSLGISE